MKQESKDYLNVYSPVTLNVPIHLFYVTFHRSLNVKKLNQNRKLMNREDGNVRNIMKALSFLFLLRSNP